MGARWSEGGLGRERLPALSQASMNFSNEVSLSVLPVLSRSKGMVPKMITSFTTRRHACALRPSSNKLPYNEANSHSSKALACSWKSLSHFISRQRPLRQSVKSFDKLLLLPSFTALIDSISARLPQTAAHLRRSCPSGLVDFAKLSSERRDGPSLSDSTCVGHRPSLEGSSNKAQPPVGKHLDIDRAKLEAAWGWRKNSRRNFAHDE